MAGLEGGGTRPLWARSGRELFYYIDPGRVMSVSVGSSPVFSAGTPSVVIDGPYGYRNMAPQWVYDVSPDGQRFVMIKESSDARSAVQQVIVVQNWDQDLQRLVPTN